MGAALVMLDDFYFTDPNLAPSITDRDSGKEIVDKGDPRSICWSKVTDKVHETRQHARLVIVEGIFALCPLMPDLGQLRAYIDTPADLSLARKILRKIREHNESAERVVLNYLERGRGTYLQWVHPTMQGADLILDGEMPPEALSDQIHRYLAMQSL
ncbi:uridine kinase family protein [Streptomyces sp. NPDC003753]